MDLPETLRANVCVLDLGQHPSKAVTAFDGFVTLSDFAGQLSVGVDRRFEFPHPVKDKENVTAVFRLLRDYCINRRWHDLSKMMVSTCTYGFSSVSGLLSLGVFTAWSERLKVG